MIGGRRGARGAWPGLGRRRLGPVGVPLRGRRRFRRGPRHGGAAPARAAEAERPGAVRGGLGRARARARARSPGRGGPQRRRPGERLPAPQAPQELGGGRARGRAVRPLRGQRRLHGGRPGGDRHPGFAGAVAGGGGRRRPPETRVGRLRSERRRAAGGRGAAPGRRPRRGEEAERFGAAEGGWASAAAAVGGGGFAAARAGLGRYPGWELRGAVRPGSGNVAVGWRALGGLVEARSAELTGAGTARSLAGGA